WQRGSTLTQVQQARKLVTIRHAPVTTSTAVGKAARAARPTVRKLQDLLPAAYFLQAVCVLQPYQPGQFVRDRPVIVVGESRIGPRPALAKRAIVPRSDTDCLPGFRYRRRLESRYRNAVVDRNANGFVAVAQLSSAIIGQVTEQGNTSVPAVIRGDHDPFPGDRCAPCCPDALDEGPAVLHFFRDSDRYRCLRR